MPHQRSALCPRTSVAAGLLLCTLLAAPAIGQPPGGSGAAPPAEDRALVETAPVVIDGEPLFRLRGLSSYPAAHRAAIVAGRIDEVASDPAVDLDTVRVIEGERDTRIVAGGRPLMSVLDADATLEGVEHRVLAQVYVEKIRNAIVAYRAARTRDALLQSSWRAAVATLAALVVLFVLRRGFRALRLSVERRHDEHVSAASVRTFDAVKRERLWSLLLSMVRFLGNVSIVLAVFLYLRYVLGLFPWTRGVAKQLAAWVFGPLVKLGTALVDNLPNLFFLAILILLTRYALRFIRVFFAAAGRGEPEVKGFDPEWAEPTYKLVRMLVIALAIVVAYPYIPGSSTPAFKGISVFAGVLISLGSSSAISNVVAGYVLIYRRVFKEGDVVNDRRHRGPGDAGATAGHPHPHHQERGDRRPELDDRDQRGQELQHAGRHRRPDPPHHGRHRLRDAVATGRGDAARGGGADPGTPPGARSRSCSRPRSATSR